MLQFGAELMDMSVLCTKLLLENVDIGQEG